MSETTTQMMAAPAVCCAVVLIVAASSLHKLRSAALASSSADGETVPNGVCSQVAWSLHKLRSAAFACEAEQSNINQKEEYKSTKRSLDEDALLQSEQRLLAALGYDDSLDALGHDEISPDDIAAFKAKSHRRTPSGTEALLRYKDRANSEPLCAIVTRWQNQQADSDAPDSPCNPSTDGTPPRRRSSSSRAAKRSGRESGHKRQKQQATRAAMARKF